MAAINWTTLRTNLETRIMAAAAELAAITTSQPDYSIDGQSVQHTARIKALREEIVELQKTINSLEPFSVISRART